MNTLLLHGILPLHAEIVNDVGAAHWIFWPLMVLFVVLVSVTLLNMLVGVMVDIIQVIGSAQKEGMTVSILATNLREAMKELDRHPDAPFTKFEFQKFLSEQQVMQVMYENGVDVVALVETSELVFEDFHRQGEEFLFSNLIDTVLNMRGSNQATVKDVKDNLRFMKFLVREVEFTITKHFDDAFNQLRMELQMRDSERDARDRAAARSGDSDSDETDEEFHSESGGIAQSMTPGAVPVPD